MSHVILTGATDLVGSAVLSHAISSPSISKIPILSRRPVKLASSSPKAQVILHQDFLNYSPELLTQLQGAKGFIWAQGITYNGMTEQDYTKITVDYPSTAAEAFAGLSEQMNFVYISGEGADMHEKTWAMFRRVKGRAERLLQDAQSSHPSLKVFNLRPALINPQGKYLADRAHSFRDRTLSDIGAVFAATWKNGEIPVDSLAKISTNLAVGDGGPVAPGAGVEAGGRTLRNTAIRNLAGL